MERTNLKYVFWVRILSVTFFINILITVSCGVIFLSMLKHFQVNTHINVSLNNETDHLLLYSKLTTDSAYLYATTRDLTYKKEYEHFSIDFNQSVKIIYQEISTTAESIKSKGFFNHQMQTSQLVDEAFNAIASLVEMTDQINKIEQQSFLLAIGNKTDNAVALLKSQSYAQFKAVNQENIRHIVKNVKALIEKDNEAVSLWSKMMLMTVSISTLLLVLTWYFSISAVRRWHEEQQRYEKELQKSQAELELRVDKRTKQLMHVNDQLTHLNEFLEIRVQEEVKNSREKETLLLQQSRLAAMGEMIGNIAHQWRQPINTLNLILVNLEDAYKYGDLTPDYLHQQIEKGERLVKTMSNTINDFRNFFKSSDAQEIFDLETSVRETLNIVEASFKNHQINVSILATKPLKTRGFIGQYQQVLLNILSNAKDALLERNIAHANIVITLSQEQNAAVVSIKDNAGGISPDIIEKIFDPYFTTRPQGTGIGLYMSKMIIENNMNGKLNVKNSTEGAEFIIETEITDEMLPIKPYPN